MNEELKITEVEATKINLQEGDVLMVTVNHEDVNQASLSNLRDKFLTLFPNNEVLVFGMGPEGYVKFTVATNPKLSYCSDCDCGKKEQAQINEALSKASVDGIRTAVENMEKETENDQS